MLLLEHDVPYQEFSKRVLDDLPDEGESWLVQEKHLKHENRRDLRHLNICSIDPPGKDMPSVFFSWHLFVIFRMYGYR